MKLIPLTQGEFTMVDDDDYESLMKYEWHLHAGNNGLRYARTRIDGHRIYMHRLILGLTDARQHADHRDGNQLNNQRDNIRPCTHAQNHANQHTAWGTSPFKGVFWDRCRAMWRAEICRNGKRYNLGRFRFEVDAAWSYDQAARILFGVRGCYNFPGDDDQGVVFPDDAPKAAWNTARVIT